MPKPGQVVRPQSNNVSYAVEEPSLDDGRHIVYPRVAVKCRIGDQSLTVEEAKSILGWQIVPRATDRSFVDLQGQHVICVHNLGNRPLDIRWCRTISRDILHRRWRFNLENIIIGRFGSVLDGQHRLISLVFAGMEWIKDPTAYPLWDRIPTLDTLIAVGGDESDKVVNTLGTGRPRTLTDVLSRSQHFSSFPEKVRASLASVCNHAIKLVWDRTGSGDEAYLVRRTTIAESLDFLDRHPRLCECANYIHAMPRTPNFWPGPAAGLLYLMGCSSTDPHDYAGSSVPDETMLDWSRWGVACEFWDAFCREEQRMGTLHACLCDQGGEGEDLLQVPRREKMNRIVKAWKRFASNPHSWLSSSMISRASQRIPVIGGIDTGGATEDDEVTIDDVEIMDEE